MSAEDSPHGEIAKRHLDMRAASEQPLTIPKLADLLGCIVGDDEHISVCSDNRALTDFKTVVVAAADVQREVDRIDAQRHVWFGVNPVSIPVGTVGRRGAEADATKLRHSMPTWTPNPTAAGTSRPFTPSSRTCP